MIRVYLLFRERKLRDETHWIDQIIEQAQEEKRHKGFILKEEQEELKNLQRYGARKAKQLGIKSDRGTEILKRCYMRQEALMRVVFDSNIYISAFLRPSGRAAKAFESAQKRHFLD
jgi:hypothetical protein